ncbi:hypothetical protein Ahy_A09g046379 isoform A [Arachis hypogaea]|uniref:Isopropylmalate dehydrogenase-like domain-containing protein n=1 Tax=Arachis hypogaea TaxID=3818 RepID=A0A445BPM4_ARAHY|nr:hypothetical protein Ahy_A09g046379 isoform A [Arachis hypogaea]
MAAKLEGGAYLSSFVDAVLEKLSPILEDDDFVLEGSDSALELLGRLERSLFDVGSVLDDAELKQFSDKKVKKWLVDLQDALYKADDLLDELATRAATATQRSSAINVIEKTVATLESVVKRKGYLRLLPKESAKMDISSWRIPSTSLVVSTDIFGRDQDKENIIKLLLDDTCDVGSPVTVIPIVGMGGIGKTTLAQLVYSDVKVVGKFDTRAWVCVAENPDPVNVTKTIIGAIDSCPASITMESEFWLLGQQLECLRVLSFKYIFLKSLPDSVGELIYLRYLNLSFTLIETLSESICKLCNLQTLKLRKCLRLKMLPSCMQDLLNLCHLDIRGASRLKEMPKGMSKLKHLNFLSDYIVSEQEENGMRELGTLDNLHGSFCISNLENVKNSGEALKAKMGNKKHINTLKLKWVPDGDIDDIGIERDILDKLQPHENLNKLSIKGYPGERFPDWLGFSCYSNMTKLSLDCCMNCCELPSLGQLPSLQHLEFSDLDRLDKIGLEFYNKNNGSFQQETPFKSLETLKIEYMYCWREWHFPDEILSIRNCPVLSGDLPAHLPALEEFTIDRCSELACSLPRAPKLQQLYLESSPVFTNNGEPQKLVISETQLAQSVLEYLPHIQPPSVQCLEIKDCRSAISISADYLPSSLQYLRISDCSKLTFLDQLQHKSLREIYVEGCDSLKLLPLGDFPNLKKLMISKCQSMECVVVPQALPSLQYLSISECPSLVSLPALTLTVPQLEELHICDCPEINCFAEEFLPPSLKTLEVTKCQKLASWITSKGLQSEGLTHLWLGPCFDVKSFPREALILSNFPNLETLDCKGLHHLTSLKSLAITDCEKLENITEQHLLASIEHIYIGEECPLSREVAEKYPEINCKIGEGGIALAEAVHGSAPDIAGKNSANPTALLLSGVSILCHLNLHDKVDQIQNAILDTIAEGKYRTADLGGKAKTTEFTNAIIDHL